MREGKGSYLSIIICLIIAGINVFSCLRVVYGYAYDTAQRKNCGGCHSIRKSKARAGTWGVRKDVIREVGSDEGFRYDKWSCDICHTKNRYGFQKNNYNTTYPSAHPVAVKGEERSELEAAGRQVMYCTNCHDASQVDRGVHSKYVTIYRLRSAGVGYGDPDPAGDTVRVSETTGVTGWFNKRSFAPGDSSYSTDVIIFGRIDHYQTANGGVFDPKNPRAGKELTKFDTLGLKSVYFCLTCHDPGGFPKDPINPQDTARLYPPDYVTYYNNSDGDDSTWSARDGGHTIRGAGTRTDLGRPALLRGDKLPCVDCHSSHSSNLNRRLLRDDMVVNKAYSILEEDGTTGTIARISREFCEYCHNIGPSNPYYSAGLFYKVRNSIEETTYSTLMAPAYGEMGYITAHTAGGANEYRSCYALRRGENYVGGCHGDPHSTPVFCAGCHKDHAYFIGKWYETVIGGNKSHPVGIELSLLANPTETLSIYNYYMRYANTAEVPLINNKIDCLTCHNEHSSIKTAATDSTAPQMQSMLRGDAGPVRYNTAGQPAGINNYPAHDTAYNTKLESLAVSGGMSSDGFRDMGAMPELCLNCHDRAIGLRNNHGGFTSGGFAICDKCHSMHGRHREPAEGARIDSTTLTYPLHYGMFPQYDNLGFETSAFVYSTTDEDGFTKSVYQDAAGMYFSYYQSRHLIHASGESQQQRLCQRCHGSKFWTDIVDTTDTSQYAPPQVFYNTAIDDAYYSAEPFNLANRRISTHKVDMSIQLIPGNSRYWNTGITCSSGTKGTGCHNPHGNNNYAQLNAFLRVNGMPSESLFGTSVVFYKGGGTGATYVSGIHTYCSLCHDLFAGYIYDSTNFDSSKGHYTFTRHPTGKNISLLNLYPDTTNRNKIDSAFFSKLILDFDTGRYSSMPSYQDFRNAPASDSTNNFLVTCLTCHYVHGSEKLHLRKFSDTSVIECVGCHSKSPDVLRYW